jgi:Fe2+ transport system protein B
MEVHRKEEAVQQGNKPPHKLRRQLAFLLVQCRFKDAEEVRRLVDEQTKAEEMENSIAMQRDFDEAIKKLEVRQAEEIRTFETGARVQREKFAQNRTVARRLYENRGKKLAAREEIVKDPERLWNRTQSARIGEIVQHCQQRPLPSTKLTRSDIKDRDVAILSLPQLSVKAKKSLRRRAAK